MLGLEDIKVGMRVNPKELQEIQGVAIILTNLEDSVGEVVFVGEPFTKKCSDLVKYYKSLGKSICAIYEHYDEEE